jgi:hypothetical protein
MTGIREGFNSGFGVTSKTGNDCWDFGFIDEEFGEWDPE